MTRINGCNVAKPFNAYLTISCYLKGLQCSNQPAHCHKLIDDPFNADYDIMSQSVKPRLPLRMKHSDTVEFDEQIKQYMFPCKLMLEFSMFHPQFSFENAHQIAPQDQIQAAAVEYGISICPFFDAAAFKEVGARKIKLGEPIYPDVCLPH